MTLATYGWNARWDAVFAPFAGEGYLPARITAEHKTHYLLVSEYGESTGLASGKLLFDADTPEQLPAVGDWVAVRAHGTPPDVTITIHAVLPRQSRFVRKEAGTRQQAQVVAANLDTVFLVIGLDGNYRPARIERYLTLAWDSGAAPVVLLTKADLCPEVEARLQEATELAPGVPVHAISVVDGSGLEAVQAHLAPGRTVALLGSSGVGKSTLVNALLGTEVQRTYEVREDDSRGRHTTTHRQLFLLPGGAMLIDTPGMREMQLWEGDGGLDDAFPEIAALAEQCRYADCTHQHEVGCAVQQALADGTLDERRYASYAKLQREMAYQHRLVDAGAARAERQRWKAIHKEIKRMYKGR